MAVPSKDESSSNKAKPVIDLGILEADDDFEEFPADGMYTSRQFPMLNKDCATGLCEDTGEINVWEDNWDDDIVEEEFSTLLRLLVFFIHIFRAEFQKLGKAFVLPEIVPSKL